MIQASEEDFQDIQELEDKIKQHTQTLKRMFDSPEAAMIEESEIQHTNRSSADTIYPKYNSKSSYHQEFWKMYLLNEILINQIKDCSTFNKQFAKIVKEADQMQAEWVRIMSFKAKTRVRRTADKIEKKCVCPFMECQKLYGTDVSLNLHMKIKHGCGTKSERESLAKEICLAEERGEEVKVFLNFPPGYLEDFRKTFFSLHNTARDEQLKMEE